MVLMWLQLLKQQDKEHHITLFKMNMSLCILRLCQEERWLVLLILRFKIVLNFYVLE